MWEYDSSERGGSSKDGGWLAPCKRTMLFSPDLLTWMKARPVGSCSGQGYFCALLFSRAAYFVGGTKVVNSDTIVGHGLSKPFGIIPDESGKVHITARLPAW